MNSDAAFYSLVQFSPHPERLEFINVGVIVYRKNAEVKFKMIDDLSRVNRVFDTKLDKSIFRLSFNALTSVVQVWILSGQMNKFLGFNDARFSQFRLTSPMAVFDEHLDSAVEFVFDEFVAIRKNVVRSPHIDFKLKKCLESSKLGDLVNLKPKAVPLEGISSEFRPHASYRNGKINLIEAVRFVNADEAIEHVGKKRLQSGLISGENKLVLVAEIGSDFPPDAVPSYKRLLDDSGVDFYRFDQMNVLVDKIRKEAH